MRPTIPPSFSRAILHVAVRLQKACAATRCYLTTILPRFKRVAGVDLLDLDQKGADSLTVQGPCVHDRRSSSRDSLTETANPDPAVDQPCQPAHRNASMAFVAFLFFYYITSHFNLVFARFSTAFGGQHSCVIFGVWRLSQNDLFSFPGILCNRRRTKATGVLLRMVSAVAWGKHSVWCGRPFIPCVWPYPQARAALPLAG